MNNENNTQAASDYPEIPLRFIINNQLSLKEIGTFATVYDMYLNGEMPITVSGICQHLPDGIVTIRKYVKRLIDKKLLIRDHALIDGHIVMTLTVFDFAAEMIEGIRTSDTVMITVSAKSGVKVGARKAYDEAGRAAATKYTAKYQARGYEVRSVFSRGKDVNEDLINAQKQSPRKR